MIAMGVEKSQVKNASIAAVIRVSARYNNLDTQATASGIALPQPFPPAM